MFRSTTILTLLAAALVSVGCGKKSKGPESAGTGIMGAVTGQTDIKRFSESGTILLKAATEPTTSFHFSYKAQSQINPKFPMDKEAKPEVGPVSLEADISPEEIKVASERGAKKGSSTATKAKEMDWAMIKLALLGPLSDISMTMAFASPAAKNTGGETLGTYSTDKFVFDTRTASVTEKAGISAAQGMLGGRVKHEAIYGTVWVDKATGMLVKVNMDADMADTAGNKWKEHYEGVITPK